MHVGEKYTIAFGVGRVGITFDVRDVAGYTNEEK